MQGVGPANGGAVLAAKVRDALLCKAPALDGGLILHENPFHLSGYAV